MPHGMILFGAMAAGDTTLGREIAKQMGLTHIDLDDHHWRWDTPIPYTLFRSREERTASILAAVNRAEHFIMSGSMFSIRKQFENLFDMAVFIDAPVEVRAQRLRDRAIARWGDRVLPGGDMYENLAGYQDYSAWAQTYEEDIRPQSCRLQHEEWIAELPCPVLRADGTKPIEENAHWIIAEYKKLLK